MIISCGGGLLFIVLEIATHFLYNKTLRVDRRGAGKEDFASQVVICAYLRFFCVFSKLFSA